MDTSATDDETTWILDVGSSRKSTLISQTCKSLSKLCTVKHTIVDYLYIELLELIRMWNLCSKEELKEKFQKAENMLKLWGIDAHIVGMTTELTMEIRNELSSMQYPLYVSFAYTTPDSYATYNVHVYKDLHCDVVYDCALNVCRLRSTKRMLSSENDEFLTSMQNNAGLAMKGTRNKCC